MSWMDRDDFYRRKPRMDGDEHFKVGRRSRGSASSGNWRTIALLLSVCLCVVSVVVIVANVTSGGTSDPGADKELVSVFADDIREEEEEQEQQTRTAEDEKLASSDGMSVLDLNNQLIEITDRIQPAIVSILNYQTEEMEPEEVLQGSGIIIKKEDGDAFIVTNHHVVEAGAVLEVVLSDGEVRDAELVGSDWLTDLAVIRIDGSGIGQVAEFGNSNKLRKGEMAVAIGNPLGLNFSQSISFGVISDARLTMPIELDGTRWEMDVIQTDAAINHGNSGGALLNLRGEVVGINSMKIADLGVEGIGFAIPINDAKPIIESLMDLGIVERPFIGIAFTEVSAYVEQEEVELDVPAEAENGLIVLQVEADGPAEAAGIEKGDIIVALDENEINTQSQLRRYLYEEKAIGDELTVTFYRDGESSTVELELGMIVFD
ncbi:S1C family serine protease [Marinicrinis sediminis]|uniref:S1C family serine protease n=1 Tax=Marinicrinis sediminis TaxID=1652465 RepID=A0ABW5RC48_9BACL